MNYVVCSHYQDEMDRHQFRDLVKNSGIKQDYIFEIAPGVKFAGQQITRPTIFSSKQIMGVNLQTDPVTVVVWNPVNETTGVMHNAECHVSIDHFVRFEESYANLIHWCIKNMSGNKLKTALSKATGCRKKEGHRRPKPESVTLKDFIKPEEVVKAREFNEQLKKPIKYDHPEIDRFYQLFHVFPRGVPVFQGQEDVHDIVSKSPTLLNQQKIGDFCCWNHGLIGLAGEQVFDRPIDMLEVFNLSSKVGVQSYIQ